MPDLFRSGPDKDIIRKDFDEPIIRADHRRVKRGMNYFGLCGDEMLDVLAWLPYLDRIFTVDWDADVVSLIYHTAALHGLLDRVMAFTANVNDFLIDGEDDVGQPLPDFSYDIASLDYYSPPLIKDLKGDARPIRAIRKLFEHQSALESGFRLLITSNVRVKDKGELNIVFKDLKKELSDLGREAEEAVNWYLGQNVDWQMKVWLPRTLDTIATAFRFSVQDFKAFRYEGTHGSYMVHFGLGFRFDPERSTARAMSPIDLLEEPLYCLKGGRLAKAEEEPPSIG